MKTALVAGATGLIGSQLLEILLKANEYSKVIAISRQPLGYSHPRLHNIVADYATLADFKDQLVADDIFCCLGTTIKVAKTKEAFRKIDYDYPVALADFTLHNGAKQYLLVSALGASRRSSVFYNQVKGDTEAAITERKFECIQVFRPSLLLGIRKEHRASESTIKRVYALIDFLIPQKYKAIDSIKVARAMKKLAMDHKKGVFIYESKDLQNF